MSIQIHVGSGKLQFPGEEIHFVLYPSPVFTFCPLFPDAKYVCVRSGLLLLLALTMLSRRYLGLPAFEFQCYQKVLVLRFEQTTRSVQPPNIVAYIMIASDFVFQSCACDDRTHCTAWSSSIS